MAEIIGVFGSAISVAQLAAQIASSALKVKSYLDQIKDAPEYIRSLVKDLENVQLILNAIEHDQGLQQQALLGASHVQGSLDFCKRAVERLGCLIEDLSADFKDAKPMRKNWTAAKMISRREKIERHRYRLSSAMKQLTLAHQVYLGSLFQVQSETIISKVNDTIQLYMSPPPLSKSLSGLAPEDSEGVVPEAQALRPYTQRRIGGTKLRSATKTYHSLLLGRALNLRIAQSQQGWQFSFSTYAYVPNDSLVVQYTIQGNIEGLQQLFSSGKASPLTIFTENGYGESTLLTAGARSANYELCKLLIDAGADPNFAASEHCPPIWSFAAGAIEFCPDPKEYTKVAQLLASQVEVSIWNLECYRGPTAPFCTLLQYADSPMDPFSKEERYGIAICLACDALANGPDVFLSALNCNPKLLAGVISTAPMGRQQTFLHSVLQAVGRLMEATYDAKSRRYRHNSEKYQKYIAGWTTVLQDLIVGGSDLHAIAKDPRRLTFGWEIVIPHELNTPLSFLFHSCHTSPWKHPHRKTKRCAMKWWIERLFEARVDLTEYGKQEKVVWQQTDVAREHGCCFDEDWYMRRIGTSRHFYSDESPWFRKRLIGFTYGPSPEDWVFWENEPTDEFVGDFWRMLDTKQDIMPGSWVE